MARIREYLIEETTRHGKLRYLFHRRPDGHRITIKGLPNEAAFEKQYSFLSSGGDESNSLQKASRQRQLKNEAPYLISELHRHHSLHMDRLVEREELSRYTRNHYQRFTNKFESHFGTVPINDIQPHHLEQVLDGWSATNNAWNNALRAYKHMFKYAKSGWGFQLDPASALKKRTIKTEGYLPWEPHHLEKFFKYHKIGSKPYLAMMLLIHIAPRRSDLVRLGPSHIVTEAAKKVIRFSPQKTALKSRISVTMPLHQDLKAAIEQTETGDKTFLVTAFGKPYSADGFSNHMLDWRRAAGIFESVSAHGMRKSVGINMAENGATEYQLMAALGHATPKVTEVYTREAKRALLSSQAASKATLGNVINLGETN